VPTDEERLKLLRLRARARARSQEPDQQMADPGFSPVSRVGIGGVDAATSLATGALAEPVAGLVGGAEAAYRLSQGEDNWAQRGEQTMDSVRETMTYQPRTVMGREILSGVGRAVEPIAEGMEAVTDKAYEAGGTPAAVATGTVLQAGPMAFGMRSPRAAMREAADVADVRRRGADLGIDTEAPLLSQRVQVVEAGRGMADPERGLAMGPLRDSLIQERQARKSMVDDLYRQAREAGGAVAQDQTLVPSLRQSLETYDLEMMPVVQRRLQELEGMMQPGTVVEEAIPLAQIDLWRRRLGANRAPATDSAQNRALDVMKGQVDEWLDQKFNADMVSGDPAAVQKWRQARGAYRRYKQDFSEDKVIRNLMDQDATVEEMRNWLFGASQTGFKRESGRVVERLKSILGEDSPQVAALQKEAAMNLVEPLTLKTPNFERFIRSYERTIKDSPTLVRQLFTDQQRQSADDLYRYAKAVEAAGPTPSVDFDVLRAISVLAFGHGIAKQGMKVRTARNAMQMVMNAGDRQARQRMMRELLGYDPQGSMFLRGSVPAAGAMAQSLGSTAGSEPVQGPTDEPQP